MDKERLLQALQVWDGQNTGYLQRIHQAFFSSHADILVLLDLLERKIEFQVALSWWLKHMLDQGATLTDRETERLIALGIEFENWQSMLHFLQMIPHLKIPETEVDSLEKALHRWLAHDNKFLRAWCYNAWHVLASQYEGYRGQVSQFFDMAKRDEAASVKARIRQIEKRGLWQVR